MPPPLVRMASRLPTMRPQPAQRLGRGEQLIEIDDAQEARATERRVINRIGSGERAGVGLRRLGALRVPARLDHHDRLGSCRRARRRHELARIFHRFDVEQDGAGVPIEREEVEKIAEVDVDLVAERDHGGKTDGRCGGPFDQPGGDRARLRDERQIARCAACSRQSWH